MSLSDAVERVLDGKPGVFGIYARNINTGETVSVNGGRVLPAESAAKSFILVYYSQLVASGVIDPAQRVLLDDEHRYLGATWVAAAMAAEEADFSCRHDPVHR